MSDLAFRYDHWNALLAEIVTPEGKADYARLIERRDALDAVAAQFAAMSPDSHPAAFPNDDDRLAYWINAYNVFTLHAILAEYPITSVWKTRDGQFFQRRRHLAGGRAVSLDDIEHEILRGHFAEPRIHFAINCGSNGCPPLRPSAYEGSGLRDTLRAATQQFLASEWNCRIDHASRRIFISRIFKMYAEDFAGTQGSSADYRLGVLQFVAQHTALPLDVHQRLRSRLQRLRLGPERRGPPAASRADSVPRTGRTLRARRLRAARAAPVRRQFLQPHLQLVHDRRLAAGLVPAVLNGRPRPGPRQRRT